MHLWMVVLVATIPFIHGVIDKIFVEIISFFFEMSFENSLCSASEESRFSSKLLCWRTPKAFH